MIYQQEAKECMELRLLHKGFHRHWLNNYESVLKKRSRKRESIKHLIAATEDYGISKWERTMQLKERIRNYEIESHVTKHHNIDTQTW